MNIVFFSPHFPNQWYLFCVQLKRQGATVLAIADQRWESLRPELREALTDYVQVPDLHDRHALLQACHYFQQRYGRIDRIESHNEYWLETQSWLRTQLDIPGIKSDRIAIIKKKSLMKQVFLQAGIPVAAGGVARTFEEARDLIARIGYPIVAKPDIGVGAAATYKIHSEAELRYFFAAKQPVEYIFESYLEGNIYTFDGLIDRHGRVVFYGSLTYSQGIMETVNENRQMYYYTFRHLPADLEEIGVRTLEAFHVRESFFHFEYFRLPSGQLVALEVNIRPPGGPTIDMYNWGADVDLYQAWAEVVVHGQSNLRYNRKYYCCFINRKFDHHYAHSHHQVMHRLAPRLVQFKEMEAVFAQAMGDIAYIVRSPSLEELLMDAAYVQQLA